MWWSKLVYSLKLLAILLGHYIELWTRSCIFLSSASHLEQLATNLSGISLKRSTILSLLFARWWWFILSVSIHDTITFILIVLKILLCVVCGICFEVSVRRPNAHILCWKCSNGSHGYSTYWRNTWFAILQGKQQNSNRKK